MKEKADIVGTPRFLYDVYFRLFPNGKRIPAPIVRLMEPIGWSKKMDEMDEMDEKTTKTVAKEKKAVKQIDGQASILKYMDKNANVHLVGPVGSKAPAGNIWPIRPINSSKMDKAEKTTKTVAKEKKAVKQIDGQASIMKYLDKNANVHPTGHVGIKAPAGNTEPGTHSNMSKDEKGAATVAKKKTVQQIDGQASIKKYVNKIVGPMVPVDRTAPASNTAPTDCDRLNENKLKRLGTAHPKRHVESTKKTKTTDGKKAKLIKGQAHIKDFFTKNPANTKDVVPLHSKGLREKEDEEETREADNKDKKSDIARPTSVVSKGTLKKMNMKTSSKGKRLKKVTKGQPNIKDYI